MQTKNGQSEKRRLGRRRDPIRKLESADRKMHLLKCILEFTQEAELFIKTRKRATFTMRNAFCVAAPTAI